MSAESPEYYQVPKPRGDVNVVTPQEVTDPSILENVADTVAGFISDVVPNSYTTAVDTSDQIQWAHFEPLEYDELGSVSNAITPPLILVLGYKTGIQVWSVGANGDATEIIGWRHGTTKVLRILPSPHKAEGNCDDLFSSKRPLMALCDRDSPGPPYCSLGFLSLQTGNQVKLLKFKNPVMDVRANRHSVVVSFPEKIAVFDAFTLKDRCTVTTCPGIQTNPIALGSRWLAYSEKTLVATRKSSGGSDSEGVQSYTTAVIECAKYLSKGIKEFGESVANSLTGSGNFKPGIVCPGSPQIGGHSEGSEKGVVTVLDIECDQANNKDKSVAVEAVIAHFIAHNEAIASLKFDPSGMLLLTADVKGYDFHVFRIHPHPVGSFLSSVHHLYILHRGETRARVQDICFSPDSRWVTVSTLRGTTHVFPITAYGGNIGVRTHNTQHVVNKMSRYHRSAGLTAEYRSNSPVSGSGSSKRNIFPYTNPRFPPYPHPTVVHALAQIKQPSSIQASGTVQSRSTNTIYPEDSTCIGACFSAPRGYIDTQKSGENTLKKHKPVESLFIIAYHGCLIQYDLDPHPIPNIPKEKICDDTPIELKTTPKAQWRLQRTPSTTDVTLPVDVRYLGDIFPSNSFSKKVTQEQSDDYWLSQVEIVTHAGPHRRLWMGPQFTFKTYTTTAGSPFSLTNIQQIDIGRCKPVNMPVTQDAVFIEYDPAISRELSPPLNTYHATFEEIGVVGDLQLKEDLADALLESPGTRDSGGRCVIVSMKPQATPVAKVVNPLGTVVTIQSDAETEKEQCEDAIIHENCDEALFRPIVAPKPILFSEGKPRTNPTDTMIVRSLGDTTEVTVKLLDKNICSNNSTTKVSSKYTNENKNIDSSLPLKKKESNWTRKDDISENDILNIDSSLQFKKKESNWPRKKDISKYDILNIDSNLPLKKNECNWTRKDDISKNDISNIDSDLPLKKNECHWTRKDDISKNDILNIDSDEYLRKKKTTWIRNDDISKNDYPSPLVSCNSETNNEISILADMPPLENIDSALIFEESRDDFKDDFDFPYLDDTNDIDKELEFKTDMFEDASDCCDNLLYINDENDLSDTKKNSKTDIITNERVVPMKTRKPKTKLGVRIPDNFQSKNKDFTAWTLRNPWKSSETNLDFSEKENCELLDISDEKTSKKSYTSVVKNVKLIHIETPADEEAAIEIVEPLLPEYRKNPWTDVSPGETTESDDSGKLLENHVPEDCTSQCVTQTVSKANKKKSKKKRK